MKILGSLKFAIGLIAVTLVFVIMGTLLESWADSHLFAAALTYHHPLFQVLLWLYFVNILFSALNRFPFEKKHIPFLMTHLGLLMLLGGVFVKNHFGVQGSCLLTEGGSAQHILIPSSFALHVENRQGGKWIEISPKRLGSLQTGIDGLELTVIDWIPHVKERLEGFIKGGLGHIVGLPPFEKMSTDHYTLFAQCGEDPEKIIFPGQPSLFFIQDQNLKEHLIAFNDKGLKFARPLDPTSYLVYGKGYGGYALFANLPPEFPPFEIIAPLTRSWQIIRPPRKKEEATPCIRILAKYKDQQEQITLGFDRFGQSFKWPILNGQFLVRFQPHCRAIPMHLRLKKASQINYPGTLQPYSFEAKLHIDHKEASLSMNHTHEQNGYRFYLANLLETENGATQVQIVVNHDPAKYWLTYPGAILLALGIVLLYLRKRYV
jgi:hypothetical protein